MATELHDSNLFFNFVFLATKVIGDGQMRPRAWNPLPLELVEPVGAGVMARNNFDSLRGKGRGGGHSTNIRLESRRTRRRKMEGWRSIRGVGVGGVVR
jgi:hypothetical protein